MYSGLLLIDTPPESFPSTFTLKAVVCNLSNKLWCDILFMEERLLIIYTK